MQCYVFLGFLTLLANFGLVAPIPVGIRVLGVETSLRTLLFKRVRPQDKTSSFKLSFLLYPPALDSFFTLFCISPLVLQKYTPPNFISSSFLEFLGNQRFFTGGLVIKDDLRFPIACFEDRECFSSNS